MSCGDDDLLGVAGLRRRVRREQVSTPMPTPPRSPSSALAATARTAVDIAQSKTAGRPPRWIASERTGALTVGVSGRAGTSAAPPSPLGWLVWLEARQPAGRRDGHD